MHEHSLLSMTETDPGGGGNRHILAHKGKQRVLK